MKPTPKRIIAGALFLLGILTVIVVGISWFADLGWSKTPLGMLLLVVAAFGGVTLALKNVTEFIKVILEVYQIIFPAKPPEEPPPSPYQTHYSQYFYERYCAAPGKPELTRAAFDEALYLYLDWVQREYNQARLFAERTPRGENLPVRKLEDVFIPLTLRLNTPPSQDEVLAEAAQDEERGLNAHRHYLRLMDQRKKAGEIIPFEALLTTHNRLAIIGGAGCGKSTLAAYLAYSLAEAALTGKALPYQLPQGIPAMLPLIIPLRNYRYYKREKKVANLQGYIVHYINDRSLKLHLAESFFERLLQTSPCLLILDGLDEVVSKGDRQEVRETIERMARAIYPQAFFLVTAREAGYQENAIFGDDFKRLDVQDLDDPQIETLVGKWCRQIRGFEDKAAEITTKIQEINARYTSQNLPPLIATPLMVTMVVSARWGENTELPRERAKLYELVVKAVLSAQYTEQSEGREEVVNFGGPWEHQRQWLARLALEMHQGGQAGAAIPESRVRAILREALAPENLDQFIEAVRYRGSLFEERDELFQFVHLTFQEFLAARRLFHQKDEGLGLLRDKMLDSWWREVFLLVYGYARIDDLEFAQRYLDWLSSQPGMGAQRLAGLELAGAALLEIDPQQPAVRRKQAEQLAAALGDARIQAPPSLRKRAGDTLGRLGDPRFDPLHWYLPNEPLLGFVEIPAGEFLMGSKKEDDPEAYDDELEQHPLYLETYYIARYPTTVAQLSAWRAHDPDAPVSDDALQGLPNQPAVWVSWYDALAYCRWLEAQLRALAADRLTGGCAPSERAFWQGLAEGRLRVCLPSEAEWEKAARGVPPSPQAPEGGFGVQRGKGIYPWGDDFAPDKANVYETGIGAVSAVGSFPAGASPYGVQDMAGNVWEWTRSLWGKDWREPDFRYPYQPGVEREDLSAGADVLRVLRGGSFHYSRGGARCAFRGWGLPVLRHYYIGFRVVVSPA